MSKEIIPSYLESETEDYVLAHKLAVVANGIALATAINQLAKATNAKSEYLTEIITKSALYKAGRMQSQDVEAIIKESIGGGCNVKSFYQKPPDELV